MVSGSVAALAAGLLFLLTALAYGRQWPLRTWLATAGMAILAGALAARVLQADSWPLTSEYEFALAFALTTALAALVLPVGMTMNVSEVQSASFALAAGLIAYAHVIIPSHRRAIQPLPPALDSIWLPLHVSAAALANGSFAVAGAAGLAWLVCKSSRGGTEPLQDRAIAMGYPLLTLSMIFGMIWAQYAWGRYWNWDLKEIWTVITWLVYTLYLHLRHRPRWPGLRLACLSLAGLAAVLITFVGVGWLARTVGLESLPLL